MDPRPVELRPARESRLAADRLESWKEIAAYLNRDPRTVQRWEKTAALPVYRHASDKVGAVYAYKSELDAWRERQRPQENGVRRYPRAWILTGVVLAALGAAWFAVDRLARGRLQVNPSVSGITARQLWTGLRTDPLGSVTPDGRMVSFADWETGDLALRDLAAQRTHRLTNKGSWAESGEWAESSVVSPDGSQIAYAWFNKDAFYELRLLRIRDGQALAPPRVLFRDPNVYWIRPDAWTPDGRHVLALFSHKDVTMRIVLVSVEDGSIRLLRSLGRRMIGKMTLSPDGAHVAFHALARETAPEREIFVLPLSNPPAEERPLFQDPADDHSPIWMPDGKQVLFASRRTGTTALWTVSVAGGGQPGGALRLVRSDIGHFQPLGFTRDGRLYYSLHMETEEVHTAEWDPATGKVVKPPEVVSGRFAGANSRPAWSPDGRMLAWCSLRGGLPVIVIRSVATGEERTLDLPRHLAVLGSLAWFPGGQFLLVAARDNQIRWWLLKVNATSAQAQSLRPHGLTSGRPSPALSPDGRTVYFLERPLHGAGVIRSFQPASQQEKQLYRVDRPITLMGLALSSDGKNLAFLEGDESSGESKLQVLSVAGGRPREMLRVRAGSGDFPETGGIHWTPDGRYVLVARYTGAGVERTALWRVPTGAGSPTPLDLGLARIAFPSVNPDGRRIAFTARTLAEWEIWSMGNLMVAATVERGAGSAITAAVGQ